MLNNFPKNIRNKKNRNKASLKIKLMIHNLENTIIVFYFKLFHFRQNEEL